MTVAKNLKDKRKWQPTAVFLPRESCGQRNLVGCHLWGCTVRHDWSNLACMHALRKEMATHSSILARRIPGTEEPGGLPSMGLQSWTQLKWLSIHAFIEEGNGNPLQYSCPENPRDRRAWWAADYGVTQSGAWLKWLSSSSKRGPLPVISPIFTNISKD